jgi:hypothetical protein
MSRSADEIYTYDQVWVFFILDFDIKGFGLCTGSITEQEEIERAMGVYRRTIAFSRYTEQRRR